MRFRRFFLAGLLFLAWAGPRPASGQASPYVALSDPAYADLDVLVSAGLVREVILGQRPYTRVDFARMADVARQRMDEGAAAGRIPAAAEALNRLSVRFGADQVRSTAEEGEAPDGAAGLRITEVRVDGTWADSPGRAVRSETVRGQQIDATLNPLLQGNAGRVLADGWTGGMEVAAVLQLGPSLVAVARPRGWLASPRGGEDDSTELTAQELYLSAALGGAAVELGRIDLFQGHGRRAGVILSRNPRGLDMVRLSTAAPIRLPWIFGGLGPAELSAMVADMGGERDVPHSKLIVTRGSFRPHPNFEFGGLLLNHQGGEGGPEATAWERFIDLFPFTKFSEPRISDKVVGLDFRLTLPDEGIDAYVEWSNTDFNLHLNRFHEMLGDVAAWVGGVRFTGLGGEGRGTLWLEGRRGGVIVHLHKQYTSGLSLDGRVLGDPLGPLGKALTLGFDWAGARQAWSISGIVEQYSGDDYGRNGLRSGDYRLNVVSDNPDETRLRAELEWSWMDGAVGFRPWVRGGVERVTTFDFVEGEDRTNAMVQVGFSWLR